MARLQDELLEQEPVKDLFFFQIHACPNLYESPLICFIQEKTSENMMNRTSRWMKLVQKNESLLNLPPPDASASQSPSRKRRRVPSKARM